MPPDAAPDARQGESMFRFADELGPAKIVHLYAPGAGLKGIVVVDNVACGPAIGGVRLAPDVSVEECVRLARAMTLKNAAAGLPHGGGKSVVFGEPHTAPAEKESLIRAFACAIGEIEDYIAGPDMGTDERCMAWVRDEIGRAVGLPRELGGIPLDEIGATGFGVAVAVEAAREFCDLELAGARVVVQGFGSVGQHAARYLSQKGAILVGASDSRGTLHVPEGIDVAELVEVKEGGGSVGDYPRGEKLDREAAIDIDCEIWIPAARPDAIRADNVARLRAKLVAQGANIPVTAEAEAALQERGVLSIPDFIANAGGVICAAVEYRGGTQSQAFAAIEEKVRDNTRQVLQEAEAKAQTPRRGGPGRAPGAQRHVVRALVVSPAPPGGRGGGREAVPVSARARART